MEAQLVIPYGVPYPIWADSTFAATDDGNAYAMIGNPTGAAECVVWIFQSTLALVDILSTLSV
jgi:hypothetical protein